MLDLTVVKKSKINLSDYDYKKDIESKSFLASLSSLEIQILEELLYSSINTCTINICNDLNISEACLEPILKKFQNIEFCSISGKNITIDKKMRKYFEIEYARFDDDFKPDLIFINNLLQKIPIHVQPIWYSLPKTSNNIFESIIERYFNYPQNFQRHLEVMSNDNPIFQDIIENLYSNTQEICSVDLQEKYNLTQESYLETLLTLEFNFICFQKYKKTDSGYREVLVPFYEYQKYLNYIKDCSVPSITNTQNIAKQRDIEFAFIKDLTDLLELAKKSLDIQTIKKELNKLLKTQKIDIYENYITKVFEKALQVQFISENSGLIILTQQGQKWLDFDLENKSLHLLYHPLNTLKESFSEYLNSEKNIKDTEKSIQKILKSGWVFFEDFIDKCTCAISNKHQIKIQNVGKTFKYVFPQYNEEEILFIKTVILEHLFEIGIVETGFLDKKPCFCVTQFGKNLFETTK